MPQSHTGKRSKFSRGSRPVQSLLKSLVSSCIEFGFIETTLPKAKAARKTLDRLITNAKKGTPEGFRQTQKWVYNPRVTLPTLHTVLRERYANRSGGYTRVHRTGARAKDRAEMAVLELVDREGDIKFEMLARTLGRKIYEEELRQGRKLDIFAPDVLDKYENWHLNDGVRRALQFREDKTEATRQELRDKAEAYRDLLRVDESVRGEAGLTYDVRPAAPAGYVPESVEIRHQLPQHFPKDPTGRKILPGEKLPAVAAGADAERQTPLQLARAALAKRPPQARRWRRGDEGDL